MVLVKIATKFNIAFLPGAFCGPRMLKRPYQGSVLPENEHHCTAVDLGKELWEKIIGEADVNKSINQVFDFSRLISIHENITCIYCLVCED